MKSKSNARKFIIIALCIFILLSTIGCGKNDEKASPSSDISASSTPSELKTSIDVWTGFTGTASLIDGWQELTRELELRFPGVVVNETAVRLQVEGTYMVYPKGKRDAYRLNDALQKGLYPDLIVTTSDMLPYLIKQGMADELDGLMAEHKLNASDFDYSTIDAIRSYSGSGKLLAIPYAVNPLGLYYNKNIFESENLPLPHDKMSWNEVMDIVERLRATGKERYCGMDISSGNAASILVEQLSLHIVDEAGHASVQTEDWERLVHFTRGLYRDFDVHCQSEIPFLEGKTALAIGWWDNNDMPIVGYRQEMLKKGESLDWAVVPVPTFENGRHPMWRSIVFVIHPNSQRKKEAMQLISYFVSREHQTALSENGRIPALRDPQVRDRFAAKFPWLKERGIQMFLSTPDAYPPFFTYQEDPLIRGGVLIPLFEQSDATDQQVLQEFGKTINDYQNKKKAEEERSYP